jgi:exonuclease SbcC
MIPVHLTLQGLYSYRNQPQVIDFTHLNKAGLFCITGAVGSGKSTILEAIIIALYGMKQADRLRGNNANYDELFNLKETEVKIEFQFIHQGKQYKAVFSKVKKKNSKNERLLYILENNSWKINAEQDIEKILGLKAEHFRQTVIIPQGRFREFIDLKPADRASMLSTLFDLQKFDISDKIKSLAAVNNNALQQVKGQLHSLENISPEMLQELHQQLIALEQSIYSLQQQSEELEQQKKVAEKAMHAKDQYEKAYQEYRALLAKETEFDMLKKELERITAAQEYKPEYDMINHARNEYKLYQEKLKKQQSILEKHKVQEKILDEELNTVIGLWEKRAELKNEAKKMQDIAAIKSLRHKKDIARKEYQQINEQILRAQTQLENLQENNAQQIQAQEKLQMQIKSINQTIEVTNKWLNEWNIAQSEYKIQQNKIKDADKGIEEYNADIEQQLAQAWQACFPDEIPGNIQGFLAMDKQIFSEKIIQIQHKISALNLVDTIALIPGQPCPVCGSSEHPAPILDMHQKSDIEQLSRNLEELQQRATNLSIYQSSLKNKQKDIERAHKNRIELNEPYLQSVEKVQQIMQQIPQDDTAESIKTKQEQLLSLLKESEQKELSIKTNSANLKEKISEAEKTIQELKINQAKVKQSIEHIQEQSVQYILAEQELNPYAQNTPEEIERQSRILFEQIENAEKKYNELFPKAVQIKQEINILLSHIREDRDKCTELEEQGKALRGKIEQKIIRQDIFKSSEELEAMLKKAIDAKELMKTIERHQAQLEIAEIKKNETYALLQSYPQIDQEAYIFLLSSIAGQMELQNKARLELGKIQGNMQDIEDKLKIKKIIIEQLQYHEKRAQLLKELEEVFKGQALVKYVSRWYLQELCHSANQRFSQLMRGTMELMLQEDDKDIDFWVRDLLHGGSIRSIRTLSGGQTFLVALSLSLALAESVNINPQEQGFFFIDEGFGSLDKNALEEVINILHSLTAQNRIIGIITHIEDVKSMIGAGVSITNTDSQGSIITQQIKNAAD